MGVLNVTPDSFSDGGNYFHPEQAVARALQMVEEGADIIDVGGESSRANGPYSKPENIAVEEELRRIIPVIQQLAPLISIPISIDTCKPEVMRRACEAGATIINDIYALRKPGALTVAAELNVPVVLMHMQNEPHNMQINPHYENVVVEINEFFAERIEACLAVGIKREHIILDPGFCFGKNVRHNCALLKELEYYKNWNLPILVGLSRKSIIKDLLGLVTPADRLYPSLALAMYAVQQGATIVRTHDVLATRQVIDAIQAVETI